MDKIIFFVIGLVAILSLLSCDFSSGSLELNEDTPLLKEPSLMNLTNSEMIITTLPSGTVVTVLDQKYGKDHLAYKVKTADGKKGYILHSGMMSVKTKE